MSVLSEMHQKGEAKFTATHVVVMTSHYKRLPNQKGIYCIPWPLLTQALTLPVTLTISVNYLANKPHQMTSTLYGFSPHINYI